MNIIDIIDKKRLNKELTLLELKYFITGLMSGDVKDYQASSLLMAICINGMSDVEVINFTKCIIESGDVFEFKDIDGLICDKHSTGGVGDKTTLMILPLAKACKLNMAKLSGRALGHTGGTIDKFESIKGFRTSLTFEEINKLVKDEYVCISTQTMNITPADKVLYALRDVTATVSSVPLIAASIMSKKIATSTDIILLDVKLGSGALVNSIDEALELSRLMIKIGESYKRKVIVYITDMDSPLGSSIGNSLEIMEVIDILENKKFNDLSNLCIEIVADLLCASKNISFKDAKEEVTQKFLNGEAKEAFEKIIINQDGDISSLKTTENPDEILSKKSGYISHIDAHKLGNITMKLGAGRLNKESSINHEVGLVLNVGIGDYVNVNDLLISVHANCEYSIDEVYSAFEYSEQKIKKELIKKKINSSS